jgi:hypothetical protein
LEAAPCTADLQFAGRLFIAAFFALPIGILQAITNQQVGLNV